MISSKKLAIVVPSLTMGGLERVSCEVANFIATKKECEVTMVLWTDRPIFYELNPLIKVVTPEKKKTNRFLQIIYSIKYLRRTIANIKPDVILSFGSIFNSLTLISSTGLGIPVFVSDRSNPYRNSTFNIFKDYGISHDGLGQIILKWFFYRRAYGIIAQTKLSKEIDAKFLKHSNIEVIGNPIRQIVSKNQERENIILNVGRFTKLKNQIFLIEAFGRINNPNWKLVFAGDGPYLQGAIEKAKELNIENKVEFLGKVQDIDSLYSKRDRKSVV